MPVYGRDQSLHLKKLEMKGFKSFAQRVDLNFDKGVTGVVGPNGCGKSNVADAIRWVLGEQSARSLRGQKMEDIIFSGTDRKKPQGLAEVTIVFDNTSAHLPVPYDEVSITRRIYRSGESEYYLNKNRCRLKDVRELLMDTGIGKEGYSIIGQGRIDEILSQRGDERRLLFDEAAGIVKFRTRKEEAEKKIKQTDENLSRLKDILMELKTQVEPLKKQAAKAEKYLMLKEKVSVLEIQAIISDMDKMNVTAERLQVEQDEWKQLLNQIRDENDASESNTALIEAQKEQCENELNTLLDCIKNSETKLDEMKTEMLLQEQAQSHLAEQQTRLEASMASFHLEKQAEKDQLLLINEKLIRQKGFNSEKEEKIAGQIERINLETQQLQLRQNRLEDNKAGIIESLNEIASLNARLERIQALEDSASERFSVLEKETEAIKEEQNELTELAVIQQDTRDNIQKAIDDNSQELISCEQQYKEIDEALIQIDKLIYQANQERDQSQHRKNTLVNMEKTFEGFQRGVKNVLRAVQQNQQLTEGFHGVIADLLRVPKGYEIAIETALGPALQHLVTDRETQGKTIIEHLKQHHQGRVTILPLNVIKGRVLRDNELRILEKYPDASCAMDLVSYPSPYQSIFENLLGRVVVVGKLETGIKIARDLKYQVKITTLEGDLIQPGGSMSGGSVSAQHEGLLVRKREIEELGNRVHDLTGKLTELNKKRDGLRITKEGIESQLISNKDSQAELQKRLYEAVSNLQTSSHQLKTIEQRVIRMQTEMNQLDETRQTFRSDLLKSSQELTIKNTVLKDVRAEVEKEVEDLQLFQKQLDSLVESMNRYQVELAELKEKARALEYEKESVESRINLLESKQAAVIAELKMMEIKRSDRTKRINDLMTAEKKLNEQLQSEVAKKGELKLTKDGLQNQIRRIHADRQVLMEKSEELIEKIHQSELKLSRCQWQMQQQSERLLENYQLNRTQARVWLNNRPDHGLKASDLAELKRQMIELGDVHIGAPEEYKRVNERLNFLDQQQTDMLEAKKTLEIIIEELEQHMVAQFREQFDKIQLRFKEVFQKLFHGGNTELVLQNPEDLLTSGIEIIAQPPGKKFQHLSLLSGGEKALTAISLLFGILLVKPSPFCVLDEIEAALDDANVSRFADFLVTLSANIQFIVVTHKKQTMERAQTLYGITMQEKGVSDLLTLKLQDIDHGTIAG
jgi:chromosome segregation protein